MNKETGRIPSLDGLRAISISLVVICHSVQTISFIKLHGALRDGLIGLGPLGVRVFFVISGFLITNILLRELDTRNRIDLPRFYFRRTLRIFAPYYFLIAVIAILQAMNWIVLAPGDVFHALTYTVNYHQGRSWYLGHGWSLSVEEQFYLLWPAALLLSGKRRGLWFISCLIIICPIIRLGYYYYYPSLIEEEISYRFETVFDALASGCVLAGLYEWLKSRPAYYRIIKTRSFVIVPILVLYASQLNPGSQLSLVCGITIQNIGIAACLAWCLTNYKGNMGRLLNCKPLVFVGGMSYSIYLWQQLFLNPFSSSIISSFPLNLLLVGAASLASYYLVERSSLVIRHRLETRLFPDRNLNAKPLEATLRVDSNVIGSGVSPPI